MAVRGGRWSGSRTVITALFLLTWAVGLWCCFRDRAHALRGPDPHASVDRVEWDDISARLTGDRTVVYVSDLRRQGQVHGRFWRAQYALAPTVVLLRYNWKSALTSLERGEARFLVGEFSLAKPNRNRRRRIRALQLDAETRNLEFSLERIGDDLLLVEVVRGS